MSRPKVLFHTKKINVSVSDEMHEGLRVRAFEDRSTPADVVRRAVEEYLGRDYRHL